MSDLISRKVVTGEKFSELREKTKSRSACLDRCFKHLQMAFGQNIPEDTARQFAGEDAVCV